MRSTTSTARDASVLPSRGCYVLVCVHTGGGGVLGFRVPLEFDRVSVEASLSVVCKASKKVRKQPELQTSSNPEP